MKILAVTGTRADWGLLAPVLTRLENDPRFELHLAVTGQHLMAGSNSVDVILAAGFSVDHAIDMELGTDDSPAGLAVAMGKALAGIGQAIAKDAPDMMLVLGDRYEILAAVNAAVLARVPVAHIAGGDVTEGAFDDAIRHAITKQSALHFVTNAEARDRVLQMGEAPENVFLVGSPGIDHILEMPRVARADFFQQIGLKDRALVFLITFHPATLEDGNVDHCAAMLASLDSYPTANLIFTGSNADPGARHIDEMIQTYVDARSDRAIFISCLGAKLYFSALEFADIVIGNSSSGLYEAPSFNLPTVNIGDRQARRLRARSVLDSKPTQMDITVAIKKALALECKDVVNPYGTGQAAVKIVDAFARIKAPQFLSRKSFHDYQKS